MAGNAHRLGIEPGAGQPRHAAGGPSRQDERQRAWPEGGGETLGARRGRNILEGAPGLRIMGDQRVEARPILGRIDGGDGSLRARIRPEAVDGLGREGHDPPVPQQGGGRCQPRPRRRRGGSLAYAKAGAGSSHLT